MCLVKKKEKINSVMHSNVLNHARTYKNINFPIWNGCNISSMNMYVFGGLFKKERFPFPVFSTIVPNRFLLSVIWLPKRQHENGKMAQALTPQRNWKNSNGPHIMKYVTKRKKIICSCFAFTCAFVCVAVCACARSLESFFKNIADLDRHKSLPW